MRCVFVCSLTKKNKQFHWVECSSDRVIKPLQPGVAVQVGGQQTGLRFYGECAGLIGRGITHIRVWYVLKLERGLCWCLCERAHTYKPSADAETEIASPTTQTQTYTRRHRLSEYSKFARKYYDVCFCRICDLWPVMTCLADCIRRIIWMAESPFRRIGHVPRFVLFVIRQNVS